MTTERTNETAPADQPKSIWDNDLPAGDSPPMPRWPLVAASVAFAVWFGFVISMMVLRLSETRHVG